MSFGVDAPYWYDVIALEEREARTLLSSNQCVIDGQYFFIRGHLDIPIVNARDVFVWGVWVSLSQESFNRVHELWNDPARVGQPPYFGWFSTSLPGYPDTLNLKTHVHMRPVGQRPLIELELTDHPLAIEQRDGITLARIREIAETIQHDAETSL
jgi:hypothetical protein